MQGLNKITSVFLSFFLQFKGLFLFFTSVIPDLPNIQRGSLWFEHSQVWQVDKTGCHITRIMNFGFLSLSNTSNLVQGIQTYFSNASFVKSKRSKKKNFLMYLLLPNYYFYFPVTATDDSCQKAMSAIYTSYFYSYVYTWNTLKQLCNRLGPCPGLTQTLAL